MTGASERPDRNAEMRRRVERDLSRATRPRDRSSVLGALSLVGSVGWPIALLSAGGALAGHALDARWGTGVAATLVLLTIGAALGSFVAARALRERGRGEGGPP